MFDYVADKGSTKIDGFIRYRITATLEGGSGDDVDVATADVTVQGLFYQSNKIVYGHRLQMPKVPDKNRVEIAVEIINVGVHDDATLTLHAYGYNLLDGDD